MTTKAKSPKKPRARRPKQQYLDPALAPPSIPEVDQAADIYYKAMQARLPYTKAESEAKVSLILKMTAHQLTKYVSDAGLEVKVTDSKNVSVKPKKEPSENGEED